MKIFGKEFRFFTKKIEPRSYSQIMSDSLPFGNPVGSNQAMSLSAVYRAVELISDSVALLPIEVCRPTGDVVDDHRLLEVFKAGRQTKYNLLKKLVSDVLTRGNGYAFIERDVAGRPVRLRYLRDVVTEYDLKSDTVSYKSPTISSKIIEAANMIHLFKNSLDGVTGVGVLGNAKRSIDLASSAENSAALYFNNGMNLSGVLTVHGKLTDEQRSDIRSSWNTSFGKGGSGLAIIESNMDYKPIQSSSSDAQMLETRQYNTLDIARFFGVSPVMLGEVTSSGSTEAMMQQFLAQTLQPYIVMIEEEFSRKLLGSSEKGYEVSLDETAIIRTDKEATGRYFGSLLDRGVLSRNEVRSELGYVKAEGLDSYTVAYSDIAQNTIENGEGNKKLGESSNQE